MTAKYTTKAERIGPLHVLNRSDVSIMRRKGYTLQEIADIYGVSRQAVSQLLKRIQSDVDSGRQQA
jgi:predicted DNA-binding protein YlxM (UPF0122 family)